MNIKKFIREIEDYPEKGVSFKDITTLISDVKAFKFTLDVMSDFISNDIDYIASIDSRGFIFGSAISDRLNITNILLRKKGKLPPPVFSKEYELEYGQDTIEVGKITVPKNKKIMIVFIFTQSSNKKKWKRIIIRIQIANFERMWLVNTWL